MAASLYPQRNFEEASIDRDHRVFGWWGLVLAVCGLVVMALAAASFALD